MLIFYMVRRKTFPDSCCRGSIAGNGASGEEVSFNHEVRFILSDQPPVPRPPIRADGGIRFEFAPGTVIPANGAATSSS